MALNLRRFYMGVAGLAMTRGPLVYVPVMCPFCGKKISNKYNLKTHIRNIHAEVLEAVNNQ